MESHVGATLLVMTWVWFLVTSYVHLRKKFVSEPSVRRRWKYIRERFRKWASKKLSFRCIRRRWSEIHHSEICRLTKRCGVREKKTKMKKRSVLLFLFPFIKLFIQHNQASIQWKAYTLGYTKILLVLSCSCETFSSYEIKKKIMLARKVSKYKCISTTAKSFTPEAW